MGHPPKIDPEFGALLPPLTGEQRAGLEADILACSLGILCPLVVWKETGILLDGHNRLAIAEQHGLPYGQREISLPSREAAIDWIFLNQRNRRNMTPGQLTLVMGRHYNKSKLPPGGDRRTQKAGSVFASQLSGHSATARRLAQEYGVNPDTVLRAGKLAAAVDKLKAEDPGIEARVAAGTAVQRDVVRLAECAPAPSGYVRPKMKRGHPCEGMRIAKAAASKLNEIREDDTEKAEAFSYMRRWLDAHEA